MKGIKQQRISDRVFGLSVYIVSAVAGIITIYPFIYVLSMSLSNPYEAMSGRVWFFPRGLSFKSFGIVFETQGLWISYYNTLWYVIVGTAVNMIMTILAAYPLSKKYLFLKNPITLYIIFTMFFSGGMIPSYLLVKSLGLYNTRWALVLPTAIATFYLLLLREFFKTIPDSLEESAMIDGAKPLLILFKVVLPLSKPALATISLFYMVGHWNEYFSALIYLSDAKLQPIQIYLRKVLLQFSSDIFRGSSQFNEMGDKSAYATQLKYSLVIVTILPIICVYPFLQKYFVKGVMIGALKG